MTRSISDLIFYFNETKKLTIRLKDIYIISDYKKNVNIISVGLQSINCNNWRQQKQAVNKSCKAVIANTKLILGILVGKQPIEIISRKTDDWCFLKGNSEFSKPGRIRK